MISPNLHTNSFSNNNDQYDRSLPPSHESNKPGSEEIKAIAEGILVSEQKLLSKIDEGEGAFSEYVTKKLIKYEHILRKAQDDYKEIFAHYTKDDHGNLLPKSQDGYVPRLLDEQLLMKLVRQSNLSLSDSNTTTNEVKTKSLKQINWKVLAGRNDSGKLQICKWLGNISIDANHKQYLGQGTYGRVQKVANISDAQTDAIKFSHPLKEELSKDARNDITNEYVKLCNVHGNQRKVGLQKPPKMLFKVKNHNDTEIGLLQPLYNRKDLDSITSDRDFTNLSNEEKLQLTINLFKGLKSLQEKNIVHGDIKPENCFAAKEDGQFIIDIADLGDAKDTKTEFLLKKAANNLNNFNLKNNLALGTVATPGYFTKLDVKLSFISALNGMQDQWVTYQEKRDLFATASTAWNIITGEEPYGVESGLYADTRWILLEEDVRDDYGSEIADILIQALDENPNKRPSVDDIIEVLENNKG